MREASGEWQQGYLDGYEALLGAVLPQLGDEMAVAIESQRLAYATPDELIYPKSEDEAALLWKSGKTAILQALQMKRGFLNTLAATLEVSSSRRIACSAYLSAPRAETFDLHTDEWDAFIIQLQGDKVFKLQSSEGNLVSVPLSPGSMLHMPQGVQHLAYSETGSLHISINFLPFPARVPA